MDINLLVNRLMHGETYTVNSGDDSSYQVTNPPTHLSMTAARLLVKQNEMLEQQAHTINNLMYQIQQYVETLPPKDTTT